jgi:hypothetical protein
MACSVSCTGSLGVGGSCSRPASLGVFWLFQSAGDLPDTPRLFRCLGLGRNTVPGIQGPTLITSDARVMGGSGRPIDFLPALPYKVSSSL